MILAWLHCVSPTAYITHREHSYQGKMHLNQMEPMAFAPCIRREGGLLWTITRKQSPKDRTSYRACIVKIKDTELVKVGAENSNHLKLCRTVLDSQGQTQEEASRRWLLAAYWVSSMPSAVWDAVPCLQVWNAGDKMNGRVVHSWEPWQGLLQVRVWKER